MPRDAGAPPPFSRALAAGGAAGLVVDVAMFPVDTVKTRLQAPGGFAANGAFRGVYRGLGAAAAGSVPGAALFFGAYEATRRELGADAPSAQIAAASVGEVCACAVRVPVEVVKQRQQTGSVDRRLARGAAEVLARDGARGFYRGFLATVGREVPFACIQMPLLERAKRRWAVARGCELTPAHVALCGSAAGGVAAALTTPLDVVKTRLMLGADGRGVAYDRGALECARRILKDEGPRAFGSGLSARVFWISLGGFLFFGAYDGALGTLWED